LSFRFSRRRFILLIGDEGAVLTHLVGRDVRRRCFAPGPDPESAELMVETLRKEPNTPIHVLVDVLEQQYREVDVPNVNIFDRSKLIRRKIAMTFPEDNLTGVLPIGGKAKGEGKYLFAAVPPSAQLTAWLEFLQNVPNPVSGLSLLPVEAVALTTALRSQPAEGAEAGRQWRLLLSRHRASGFRQVITHSDRLVFTRMTPGSDENASPAAIIENIEREFASTVSYLRRLSFSEADRIELTVLAEPQVCEGLDAKRLRIKHLTCLTPAKAAQTLGLVNVADPDDGYSDVLYSAWFAQKQRPVLSIQTSHGKQTRLLDQAPRWLGRAAFAAGTVGAVYCGLTYHQIYTDAEALAEKTGQRSVLSIEKQGLEKKVGNLEVAPDRLAAVIDTNTSLNDATPRFSAVIQRISQNMDPQLRIARLDLSLKGQSQSIATRRFGKDTTPGAQKADPTKQVGEALIVVTVQVSGASADREASMQSLAMLVERLRKALPGYTVAQTRDPFNLAGGAALSGTGGLSANRDAGAAVRLESDITITGPA
jgi:hypothetical protein